MKVQQILRDIQQGVNFIICKVHGFIAYISISMYYEIRGNIFPYIDIWIYYVAIHNAFWIGSISNTIFVYDCIIFNVTMSNTCMLQMMLNSALPRSDSCKRKDICIAF